MEYGLKLKKLRESNDLSQSQVAKIIGISRQSLGGIETDKRKKPDKDILFKLAHLYKIDENDLYEAYGYMTTIIREPKAKYSPISALAEVEEALRSYMPVYAEVSAGSGVEAIDYVAVTRNRPVPESWRAYRIKGMCLEPEINDRDTVICDTALKDFRNGDLVVCVIDNTAYIKRLKIEDGKIWLTNNYGKYEPNGVHIHGVVVEVIKKYR